jgi:Protein of unknown function (DUF3572)
MHPRQPKLSHGEAESVAIKGLQHIAGDSELLARFLALSGIYPQDMREAANSPTFLSGVMDFFMGDEPALLAFAASIGEGPATIAAARAILLHDDEFE